MTGLRRSRYGLTLPELLLGMSGTAIVALAAVTMLFAAVQGSDDEKSARSLVVEGKVVSNRLSAMIRGSRRLLNVTSTRVILWSSDADNDGLVDVDELRVIDHTPASTQLSSSVASSGATPAEYDALATTFSTVVADLETNAVLDTAVWSNRVSTFALTSDAPTDPQGATLLSYQLEVTNGAFTETVAQSVALRNRSSGSP
ncbi:MAG: hypothetical protein AAGB29_01650 [Planctomycetota bacterium]